MTSAKSNWRMAESAFTLIELLVVIAIIGILAALIFPAAAAIKKRAIINRTQTELDQVIVAIDLYKEKLGTYPPDHPVVIAPGVLSYTTNQLFYELVGTKLTGRAFETLDGSQQQLTLADVASGFGGGVSGFVNCTKGGGDEGTAAKNFIKAHKPGQTGWITNAGVRLQLLTCSVNWSKGPFETINPWRYNSSNPTNNPGSYDLWVDVLIAGKTNRISNWRRQPLPVATP
jgi:prepilin-type N-terminal cleavage/methylation domain-containing protein